MPMLVNPRSGAMTVNPAVMGSHAEWFRDFLRSRRVYLNEKHVLTRALLMAEELGESKRKRRPIDRKFKKEGPKWFEAYRDFCGNAFGADMMTAILRRTIAKTADPFSTHWKHFKDPQPIQTKEGSSSLARNRLWELFVAAIVGSFADDIRAEEPDVTCTFGGTRWGIACKTLYGADPRTHLARIVEGAKQLEDADASHGIILVNLVNVLPQRELFGLRRAWDFSGPRDPVIAHVERVALGITNNIPRDELARRLSTSISDLRNKSRAVLFFCPTMVHVNDHATLVCVTFAHEFRRIRHELEIRFLYAFMSAIESAMSFQPASSTT